MVESTLGLLFTINADPSKAQDALQKFEQSTGKSFERAAAGTKPFDTSLLNNRESVRLLSEEMGVHLPRAVSGAISEMLPNINMLGGALLGAFAVQEVVKFTKEIYKAAQEASGMAEAAKLMAEGVKENTTAMEEYAASSSKAARSEINELNARIANWTVMLQARQDYFDQENALSYAMQFYLGEVNKTTKGVEKLHAMETERDKLLKILTGDEKDAAEEAKKAAKIAGEAWERRTEQQYEFFAERRKQSQEEFEQEVRLSEKLIRAYDRTREMQEKMDVYFTEQHARMVHANDEAIAEGLKNSDRRIEQEFRLLERHAKQVHIAWANEHPLLANITEDLKSMGIAAKTTSVAKLELTAVTAQFRRATIEEIQAVQDSIAASGELLAAGMAGLIGGRKAQAGVEAVWEVARGIALIAEGTWPPNPAALIAAGLHFEAAAQYGILAGSGSSDHTGAGAGSGNYRSGVEHGGYEGGRADSGIPPQTLAPGSSGAGGRFGEARVVVFGTDHELQNWVAGAINGAVRRGVTVQATSSQRGAPVGH